MQKSIYKRNNMEGNGFVSTSTIASLVKDGSDYDTIKTEPITSSLKMRRRLVSDGIGSGEKPLDTIGTMNYSKMSNKK